MKIATWNVNSLRVRLPHLLQFLQDAQPDVVCLQETKLVDKDFPADAIREAGWEHLEWYGQKTYNGVAMISRHPITDVHKGFLLGDEDPHKRLIRGTVNGITLIGGYFPNGSPVGSDNFRYKLRWYRRFQSELRQTVDLGGDVLICGDFNICREEIDCWDPFSAAGNILFHPQERATLAALQRQGLTDALRIRQPDEEAFTWWDYRGSGFQKNQGFRIDMHLVSERLVDRVEKVVTWRDIRGWDQPSDHVPVVCHLADTAVSEPAPAPKADKPAQLGLF